MTTGSLPPIYATCGRCRMQVLVIFGGTVKKGTDGTFMLVCPFCED
jgi:hypothetical protein